MDFELVLERLGEGFERRGIRAAAMGGFAMGLWGAQRATNDLDFLVHKDDLEKLHSLMSDLGYKRIFHSENVAQYSGETVIWGHVDFLIAFRPLALEILDSAEEKPVLGALLRAVRPEDLIGFKVQAVANNPEKRRLQDEADIESLVRANAKTLDWERVRRYYRLFEMEPQFEELKKRWAHG